MIYELKHFLFGWDYIAWQNTAGSGVARVHKSADGRVWYFRYGLTGLVDTVRSSEQVVWLTCRPDKYLSTECVAH